MKNNKIQTITGLARFVGGTGLSVVLLAAAAAWAQEPAAPETMKPVIVTGTYIASENAADTLTVAPIEMAAPVNVGYASLQDVLRTKLTPFGGPGFVTPGFGNGGDGSSGIALRGMPANATLLLVNGRRTSTSDLNLIPESAIERVEVLKDGAGAIYGTDAVAGVVNVILKENFQGVNVKAYYGFNDQSPSISERKFSIMIGENTEKASLLLSANYSASDPLYSPDRDRSKNINPWQTSGTRNPGVFLNAADLGTVEKVVDGVTNIVPAALPLRWTVAPGFGVATNAPPGFNPFATVDTSMANDINEANSIRTAREAQLNGLLPEGSQLRYGNSPRFQYPLYTTAYRPHETFGFNGASSYKIFEENLKVFAAAYYMHNSSELHLAPSPLSGLSVTPDNYYFQQLFGTGYPTGSELTYNYRMVEAGPRISFTDFDSFHFVGGLKGQIAQSSWNWEAGFLYDRVLISEKQTGGIIYDDLYSLLGLSTAGAWNPFGYTPPYGQSVANSADTVAGLTGAAYTKDLIQSLGVDVRVGGEVFNLPAGPAALSVGYAFRNEQEDYEPDYAVTQGLIGPYNVIQELHESRDVNAFFGEVFIPILGKDLNIPAFSEFSVSAAARYEDYSDVGDTGVKPRVSFRWKPLENQQLTIRGSYAQGFSAPGFFDLYQEPGQDFVEVLNPVTGVLEQPTDAVLTIGNPNLKPTESDTWLIGATYSPDFLKGFTIGVDYYRIEQEGIPFQSADYIVQQWYAYGPSSASNPFRYDALPSSVNPLGSQVELNADGSLYQIRNVGSINSGKRLTDGIDFMASQRFETDWGTLTLAGQATWMLTFEQEDFPGAGTIDYLGRWWPLGAALSETGYPEWRANVSLTYEYKRWLGTFAWNYTAGYDEPASASWDARRVGDYNTFDLRVGFKIPKIETELLVGVNNLFDADPPLVKGSFENNYDRAVADIRGRTIFVSLNKTF